MTDLTRLTTYNPYSVLREVEEDEAARCIQRNWRNSRSGIDLLQKDRKPLSHLSYENLRTLYRTSLKHNMSKGIQLPGRIDTAKKTIVSFHNLRKCVQKNDYVVICTSIRNSLPACKIVHKSEISDKYRRVGEIYLSPEAIQDFSAMRAGAPRTREELDRIVQTLAKLVHIVPYGYSKDGCYARARFAVDFMKLCGFHRTNMGKQYVFIPEKFRVAGKNWVYHVAPVVRLIDGSSWIIDPALFTKRAVSVREWIDKQMEDPKAKMLILNKGYIHPNREGYKPAYYLRNICLTFTTGPYTVIQDIDQKARTFTIDFKASDEEEAFAVLSEYRVKIETQRIFRDIARKECKT